MPGYGDFVEVLDDVGVFLIFIIPILTMRILAEDKKMVQRFYC